VLAVLGALAAGALPGAARAQDPAQDPAQVGRWSPLRSWPDTGTHLVLLPNGKVLNWGEYAIDAVRLWDWEKDAFSRAPWPGFNVFCAGHTLMPDGRLFVTGGHKDSDQGLPHAALYDAFANRWTRLPDMNAGRWYPTNLPLPNGEMLTLAGTATARFVGENELPQVWQPSLGTWRDLTGATAALRTYPWMFVAPSGRVFMAGPGPRAQWLETEGAGGWSPLATPLFGDRFSGSAVMYEEGKVMVSGGGERLPTATAEVLDLHERTPAFRRVAPMAQARKQHTATLLPDGTVLLTGGSSGPGKDDATQPNLLTELWDPGTERFTRLAPVGAYRGYHSAALLLPDGRVLSTGGSEDTTGPTAFTAQVFSPPYLFKGPRPTVAAAPAEVGYGETFLVRTPDAASIGQVTLLAPGAVTHAYDQGQRIHRLAFSRTEGGLRVTAPATRARALPGHYMLFLVSDAGVPSVATWVQLRGASAPLPEEAPVVAAGGAWRAHARAEGPGEGWQEPGFDDSGWASGSAPFHTDASAGGTRLQTAAPSAYFRKRLVLRGPVLAASLRVLHEDGVGVWINGRQVLARNLGESLAHGEWAGANALADTWSRTGVSPSVFREGENVIAVLLKRVAPAAGKGPPPMRFDLELGLATQGSAEAAPLLTLTAPNGGESFEGGGTLPVTWRSEGGALAAVSLAYSLDDGENWTALAEGVPNTGAFTWTLPALDSARARLRVSPAGGAVASADASDAPFTLRPGTGKPPGGGGVGGGGPPAACPEGTRCQGAAGEEKGGCAAGAPGLAPATLGLLVLALVRGRRAERRRQGRAGQEGAAR
jgi:hypothetical protein